MTKMRLFSGNSLHFTLSVRLCFVVTLTMIALFSYYIWLEKQIDTANNRRYLLLTLINEYRRSGDHTSQLIRDYAINGDPAYRLELEKIIAIGEGELPPASVNRLNWDLRNAGVEATVTDGQAISLLSLMEKAGFTRQELELVLRAKGLAAQLAETDARVMQSLTASNIDETKRFQVLKMLSDQRYARQKTNMLALIDKAMELVEQRTENSITDTTHWAWLIRNALIASGCILLILLGLCEKLFLATFGAFPKTVYRTIRCLANHSLECMPVLSDVPENSVMSHLIETKHQLHELEKQKKQSQQSLQLMSKVFSEAQEGIFLTDAGGILIDVNSAYLDITGYRRDECIGQYISLLASDQYPEGFQSHVWTQVRTDGRWRGEIWNVKKNGEPFAAILNFSAVNDDDGHLLCYLGMLTDITQLKQHQKEIEEIAFHDAVTSLANRPLLADRMQQALALARRNHTVLAVACLDLDGFKAVNDTYGHSAGDHLLIEVAHRLLNCVRESDTVARLGGDEFAILLCGIESREHCENTLHRVLKALTVPHHIENHEVAVSASIGYTVFPEDSADPDTLLRHADQAMYVAKQAGKNRFQYFDARKEKQVQINWLVLARIEKALKKGEFCLYIQPKINLRTKQIVGAEALIRWRHPIRGMLLPGEFLPLTENNDLSIGIGEWTIKEAFKLMQGWHGRGLLLPLSVNVSAHQLRQKNFCDRLAAIVESFPALPAGQLELEIIESAALDDLQKISELIARCKSIGINFALDDFGTGYSSLNYLRRLAVSTLKIDHSFIQGIVDNETDSAIVRGIIGLANAFNTNIIAEGLENQQQAEHLLDLGCELAQGYFIAPPMPAEAVSDWINGFQLPKIDGALM